MRWQNREQSSNVEDRRGQSGRGGFPGGFPGGLSGGRGLGGIPVRGKMGLLLFAVVVLAGLYGIDLSPLLTGMDSGPAPMMTPDRSSTAQDDTLARFSSVALKTTEDTWRAVFQREFGQNYAPPKLVLYSGSTDTACGYGQSAMGPFYCPDDRNVYIDLSFYRDMEKRLGGGGDFALGYVLAHEVGHHVQNLLGIAGQVRREQSGVSQARANRLSVMLELQADCLAGVWGHAMQKEGILEAGDLEEALNTATAIGDDRLQRQSMGRVVPDAFTHGTSAQRYRWFKEGFDSGDVNRCNTFNGID